MTTQYMASDERLANRIREQLTFFKETFTEKKMFGGICFLYEGKMTVGIAKNNLMARVKLEKMEENLAKDFVRPMDFTKKPMKEFIYVYSEGFETELALLQWIEL
ncbi:TfoX/Sxy family protein [Kordia sp.]|uniref:TfoX/Sxy family protein n=1 Tax=Kordia sp. TaxID=1965332 RepID=UPI0025BA3817|nr:TfoX/Sxy family protein [Kordia sp.]MCH2193941.1 TfoX/Sxy family protein [Kordia sp.]